MTKEEMERHSAPAGFEFDDDLKADLQELIDSKASPLILNILLDLYPGDIAYILNALPDEQVDYVFSLLPPEIAGEVMLELDDHHRTRLLESLSHDKVTEMVTGLDSDDAADIVAELPDEQQDKILGTMEAEDSKDVQELLLYAPNTAGGIMAKEVATVHEKDTVKKAIQLVRRMAKEGTEVYNVYVVTDDGVLVGAVPIQQLLLNTPNRRMIKLVKEDPLKAPTDMDQEEVAKMFSRYDLVSLPVVDKTGRIVGRITVDDVVDVLQEEHEEDVARYTGSTANEYEQRSPAQVARLRLPWVLMTLSIQFIAGFVIHVFDATLSKVILLASFMPIISAISGNTGLQSAAVIVRGIATGSVDPKTGWSKAVKRQIQTTGIIGGVCGAILMAIGWVWHGTFLFGFAVGISMFLSVNISGFIGTSTPMLSHRLGFDPAITAGPFETALQDVLGITIFLTIATLLIGFF